MKNTDKRKNFKLTHVLIPFILLFLLSAQIFAQQETKPRSFSIHAGLNRDVDDLDNTIGPSLSFHYAYTLIPIFVQLELMLFFDGRSIAAISNEDKNKSSAIGLAPGLRINILSQKNWNPSFVIMPGIAYASKANEPKAKISYALCFVFSNTFFKKHMISIGFSIFYPMQDDLIFILASRSGVAIFNIKYGFWF